MALVQHLKDLLGEEQLRVSQVREYVLFFNILALTIHDLPTLRLEAVLVGETHHIY